MAIGIGAVARLAGVAHSTLITNLAAAGGSAGHDHAVAVVHHATHRVHGWWAGAVVGGDIGVAEIPVQLADDLVMECSGLWCFRIMASEAHFPGELLGTLTGECAVQGILQDLARHRDGVLDIADLQDAAEVHVAGHQRGIHADLAVGLDVGAGAGVEQGIVLQHVDGPFADVQGAHALTEIFFQRRDDVFADSFAQGDVAVVVVGPAVNDDLI